MDDDKPNWVLRALVILAVGGAAFYYYYLRAPASVPIAVAPAPAPAPAAPPSAALPKLEESDAFARTRLAALSPEADRDGWLKGDDLLLRAAAAADMLGRGRDPKDALAFLAPRRKFAVAKKDGALHADPRSYARYDALGAAFSALDVSAAAKAFVELEPLLDAACREHGCSGSFRETFGRAVVELLKAPVPPVDAALVETARKGIGYSYADPALESLSPAQKQLMRLGPKNQAAVQAKLRELATALGLAVPAR